MRPLYHQPDLAMLVLRVMVAIVGIYHGSQKLFGLFGGPGLKGFSSFLESIDVPMPMVSAVMAGGAECFGGLLVGIGLLTRFAAIPFLVAMVVAIAKVHPGAFSLQNNGMEYALTIAAILLAIALAGPGRFSVDALVLKRWAPSLA